MPLKWMCTLAMILLLVSQAAAAGEADLQIKVLKPGAVVTVDRVVEDGKLIISADDAQKKPLLGLGAADFTITQAGVNNDVNLRLGGEEAFDPSAWTFQVGDKVWIKWTNPDSGNMTWGLEVGLALAS